MPAHLSIGLLTGICAVPAFIGMHLLFPPRYSLSRVLLGETFTFILSLIISILLRNSTTAFPYFLCFMLYLASMFALFQGTWFKKLFAGSLFVVSFIISLYFVSALLPGRFSAVPVRQLIPFSLILLLTVFFIDSAVVISMKRISRFSGKTASRYVWLLYLLFPICQFLLIDRTLVTEYDKTTSGQIIFLLLSVVFSLASDIALIYVLDSVSRGVLLRTQAEALTREVSLQSRYYQQVTQYYEHLRQLRHDLSNHLYTLRIQLQDGHLTEARQYADHMREEGNLSDRRHFCSHPVADLFLMQTAENLTREQFTLEAELDLPADLCISNGDLICVLGTLIDRSVHVSSNGTDHTIHLKTSCQNGVLSLRCCAPHADGGDEIQPDDPILTRIADRYHGSFSSMTQADMVTDEIILFREVSK